ncbi:uncharacterized protein B0I36DRAFT_387264 [Microdochium trichocladiopsis]|uniref:Uncharacterized protein n=1 Tax=Microdochium trichocladiopsis TaxID=1682393 RepID=A0A9P8XX09_9PEZI|nr:uncharacterized protein B0I36DRAFT_387264 [Microdochium trichocladiopsis]KAH7024809.1 hypothetical protein B0I36DRAFT_387264 [Microdochium trichocladiopsis]
MAAPLFRHRPSDLRTARALSPPTTSSFEFELAASHPKVYPFLPPLASVTCHLGSGMGIREALELDRGTVRQGNSSVTGDAQTSPQGQYCDPRLQGLRLGCWTRVKVDEAGDLAAGALSHFLSVHFPIFACFDADLFLRDLLGTKGTDGQHCSSFLITSVMNLACQSYTTFDVRAAVLSLAFGQEAETLWKTGGHEDKPVNMAAMCYLAMASGLSGHEDLSFNLLLDNRAMAQRCSFFGRQPTDEAAEQLGALSGEQLRLTAAAAWGGYGWLTYHAMHYPEDPIQYAPTLPMPGTIPDLPLPTYVGETFTSLCKLWPLVQEIQGLSSFKNPPSLSGPSLPLGYAESQYQRLLAWADQLPAELCRNQHCSSHVYFFFALYHHTTIKLFQPFLDASPSTTTTTTMQNHPSIARLRSFSARDSCPLAIYAASLAQLKRLVVLYWLRSRRDSDTGWFTAAVLQVTNAVLRSSWYYYLHSQRKQQQQPQNPRQNDHISTSLSSGSMGTSGLANISTTTAAVSSSSSSSSSASSAKHNNSNNNSGVNDKDEDENTLYLNLCFSFWKEAYVRYRVYLQVAQANVFLSLRLGLVDRPQAARLMRELRSVGPHHDRPETASNSAVVDYESAARGEVGKGSIEYLAGEFRKVFVEE